VIDIDLANNDLTHYLLDISSTEWPIYKKYLTRRKIPIENYSNSNSLETTGLGEYSDDKQ